MQEEDTELELLFTEEEPKEKYKGGLEKEMCGPTFQLVSKVMKTLFNQKITVPYNFMGHSNTPAVSCSFKATSVFIYPLEGSIMFVYKPPNLSSLRMSNRSTLLGMLHNEKLVSCSVEIKL